MSKKEIPEGVRRLFQAMQDFIEQEESDRAAGIKRVMTEEEVGFAASDIEMDNPEIIPVLAQTIIENGLQHETDNECYTEYSADNKGCNINNPFVISTSEPFYTRLEYDIIDFLFHYSPIRQGIWRLDRQSLRRVGDKRYDCLRIEHIIDKGRNEKPEIVYEDYWFDITNGIKGKRNRCS